MTLSIETFRNADTNAGWRPGNNFGGSALFKAIGHPKTAVLGHAIVAKLRSLGRIAVYDPAPAPVADHFDAFFGLRSADIAGVFVQRVEDVGAQRLGQITRPITELAPARVDALFVAAFDAEAVVRQLGPLLPAGLRVVTLDEMRLPDDWLSNPRHYLDPLNFATNFALMREAGDIHSRLTTANYWGAYGAAEAALWLCLFNADGTVLAEWIEPLGGPNATVCLDSKQIRQRFGLGEFNGSLFVHAIRVKGHDVVKYGLDLYSDDGRQLSSTHDANAWPADLYAGVPAPDAGERIVLWVQNSHPLAIPAGAIGFNIVGSQDVALHEDAVPPFATRAVDLNALLPDAKWPSQIEVRAGRYFVRPRYETVRTDGRLRIAHANVERTDLKPDPKIPGLAAHMGKGYIMPLPVLPVAEFRTVTLPTPMADRQHELPLRVVLHDADGSVAAEKYLGRLPRRDCPPTDIDDWLKQSAATLKSGIGHVEYLYDFRDGGEADGWLHALAKFERRSNGHSAETIFGAHIYNTPVIYRDEPQSYTHKPPGLTTRLFLGLGDDPLDTICHLVYPASLPWVATSTTLLTLFDADAREVARRTVNIPCGGSLYWRVSTTFSAAERAAAGNGAWVQVRDTTCRLFGFHGLLHPAGGFSVDHMFGF